MHLSKYSQFQAAPLSSALPARNGNTPLDHDYSEALSLVSRIAKDYGIASLDRLLASCRSAATQEEISVAVVGRFKAGKSSFLNDLLGSPVLPVGVLPVTSVVTEVCYGPEDLAEVRFFGGHRKVVPLESVAAYISERENPENVKRAELVSIRCPGLERYKGLKFVDTPGLESALAHNTQASLGWLPNVGLALVAVSVDPPLSQQDITLLNDLYKYTPKVSVLLTKVDLLSETERTEVLAFIREQLTKIFEATPHVFPYSTRPDFTQFKTDIEQSLITDVLGRSAEQRRAIVARKLDTLLRESGEYLTFALKAAELLQLERSALMVQVLGEKNVLEDTKSQLRLIASQSAAGARSAISARLDKHQNTIEGKLVLEFESEFPSWSRSLAAMLEGYEAWLRQSLSRELGLASAAERANLLSPLHRTVPQLTRALQGCRDRLSDRVKRAFGVSLETTEPELDVSEPAIPDVRIGQVFDRNWELLSPVLPATIVAGIARNHFLRKVSWMVEKNISRLTTQWEESFTAALRRVEKESEERLNELIGSVEQLLRTSSGDRIPAIRRDLESLASARKELGTNQTS